uniref:N-acetyllactosaminide beta-1,3-N-acetylglucosaminyltransferase n=1 Tax=Anopheles atroparvus TaxID=41427 RepID=A0AAG5CVU9_ANOAO
MTGFSSSANYKPLHTDDVAMVARRTTVLRTVLLFVIVFFVLFCLMGYYYQPRTSADHAGSHYPTDEASYEALLRRLKTILNCNTQPNDFQLETHGGYYLLRNFVSAQQPVECYETITYTTHGDYTFLDNVVPLLERWRAPLSVALYAPGYDLDRSVEMIRHLLDCHERRQLVRQYVSFHLYFGVEHLPERPIRHYRELMSVPLDCTNATNLWDTLYDAGVVVESFRAGKNLSYPVNVGRNVARSSAQTHFVLASDIELYPNPDFIPMFLRMIAHPFYQYTLHSPGVYVLPVFEVAEGRSMPEDKAHLLDALQRGEAIKFHEKICSNCHTVPGYAEWLGVLKYDFTMDIQTSSKRTGAYVSWEPIYVGTKREPEYDERLSWEGKADKMTQGYIMCILGYDFHVLDNGFLVHRPGIKTIAEANRPPQQAKQRSFIRRTIANEIHALYGHREGCKV